MSDILKEPLISNLGCLEEIKSCLIVFTRTVYFAGNTGLGHFMGCQSIQWNVSQYSSNQKKRVTLVNSKNNQIEPFQYPTMTNWSRVSFVGSYNLRMELTAYAQSHIKAISRRITKERVKGLHGTPPLTPLREPSMTQNFTGGHSSLHLDIRILRGRLRTQSRKHHR